MALRTRVNASRVNRGRDVHFFVRQYNHLDLSGGSLLAPYLSASVLQFNNLPGPGDFTTLFDRYMITHWQLKFYLTVEPGAQAAGSAIYPRMWYVKDYDDVSNPSNLDALRQNAKCRTVSLHPSRPVVINIKPAVLAETYKVAGFPTYSPKWKQWIDMENIDVPHYGLKVGIDDFTNTNYRLRVEGRVWFACKDTR